MRIDRPIQIAESAHPLRKLSRGHPEPGLGGPVDHDEPRAVLHDLVELGKVRVQEVTLMPRAENDNGGGIFQNTDILRVSVLRQDDRLNAQIRLIEPFRQQHVPGAMLVLHRAVARLARDENDLGPFRRWKNREASTKEKQKNGEMKFHWQGPALRGTGFCR